MLPYAVCAQTNDVTITETDVRIVESPDSSSETCSPVDTAQTDSSNY